MRLYTDNGDQLLIVNPRYTEKVLVLNTRINGRFGTEVRPAGFDFTPGADATITIEAGEEAFNFYQNAELLTQFAYRGPVRDIKSIVINSLGSDVVYKSLAVILK